MLPRRNGFEEEKQKEGCSQAEERRDQEQEACEGFQEDGIQEGGLQEEERQEGGHSACEETRGHAQGFVGPEARSCAEAAGYGC